MNNLTKDEKIYINKKVENFLRSDEVHLLKNLGLYKLGHKFTNIIYKYIKSTQEGKEALKLAKKFGGTYIEPTAFNFKKFITKSTSDDKKGEIKVLLNWNQSLQISAGDDNRSFSQKIKLDSNTYEILHNLEEKSHYSNINECLVLPEYNYSKVKYDRIEKYYITFTTWEVPDSQRLAKIEELINLIKSDIIKNIKDYFKEALDESSN